MVTMSGSFEIEIDDAANIEKEKQLLEKETTNAEVQQQPQPQPTDDPLVIDVDDDMSDLRPNSILLQGVDDLSTNNVERYIYHFCPKIDHTIEWVNDTSLNIVCSDEDSANTLMEMISESTEKDLPKSQLRKCKPYSDSSVVLQCRISLTSDRKVRNARAQSRYYLHHGEPGEELHSRFDRGGRHEGRRSREPVSRERSRSRSPLSRMRGLQGDDLFPEKLRKQQGPEGGRRRNARLSRSRSPPAQNLSSRLDSSRNKWIKGELLNQGTSFKGASNNPQ